MLKRFIEWITVKSRLHDTNFKPPFFKEGEIWWAHTGENIGNEMNGKGEMFTRPIYIFKKYDRYSFLALPLSTKIKTGTWYCSIEFSGKTQIIILAQGRVLDYRRLKEKAGELWATDKDRVREMYGLLHKT
jgi:mRNA interferase MazF